MQIHALSIHHMTLQYGCKTREIYVWVNTKGFCVLKDFMENGFVKSKPTTTFITNYIIDPIDPKISDWT